MIEAIVITVGEEKLSITYPYTTPYITCSSATVSYTRLEGSSSDVY